MGCVKEILAPAGSLEALYAAVKSGADAVYLGGKAFNARRNADNFSYDELKEAVAYCHARGVKVYITLNTLINDGELKTAQKEIECACSLPADALILQDVGLASLVKKTAPDMPLHASTQMSVQSAQGVKLLEKAGFSRVVLARELSKEEIRKIAAETNAELEVFVHGALCMCVSGQCLMSSVLGRRSGNRGLCAQPCRLPFGVNGAGGNNLSLKDLSLIDELEELSDIGVTSFKIEGRMKRPEYVAAAVTACRNSLEKKPDFQLLDDLKAVFSRTGFTKGYYENSLGPAMFGTRRKEDVTAAAPVLKKLSHLYDKEHPKIPVDFMFTCVEGEALSLCANASGKNVFIQSDCVPEKALNKPLTREALTERLSKCGGTQFYAGDIDIELDEGLIAPAGVINSLRREALKKLDSLLGNAAKKEYTDLPLPVFKAHGVQKREIHIRIFSEAQLPATLDGVSKVVVPLTASREIIEKIHSSGAKAEVEMPRAVFSNSEIYAERLAKAKENGADSVRISGLDTVLPAKLSGLPVSAGFGTNIFNSVSAELFEKAGFEEILLSPELSLLQISKIGGSIKRGIIAYGRLPLMLTRNCPVKNRLSCRECGGKSHLTDRMGVEFPVLCSNGCSEILNSRPVYLADRLDEIKNVDFIELYFTKESKEECENTLRAYASGSPVPEEYTRGLYYRGVE